MNNTNWIIVEELCASWLHVLSFLLVLHFRQSAIVASMGLQPTGSTSMVSLRVTTSDALEFENHTLRICCQARQSLDAMRTVVANGLHGQLSKMLCGLLSWHGCFMPNLLGGALRDNVTKNKLQAYMRRLIRFHYLPEDSSKIEQLCSNAYPSVFSAVLADKGDAIDPK